MVIFFDIDGTIIDDATQIIPESTVEAVRLLRANGHLPVVNTGRPFGHIDPRVREMDFGGWICGCGMEILVDGVTLYSDYPSEEICHEVVRAGEECGMQLLAEGRTDVLYDHSLPPDSWPAQEGARMRSKGFQVLDLRKHRDRGFMKFVTFDAPGCQRQRFIRAMAPWFDAIDRGGTMLEFVKTGNSKARGMERLMERLGIPREDSFAIGDSTNDLPMFRAAGTAIALGGGMEELKREADYITAPVDHDGIFLALRHYGLI